MIIGYFIYNEYTIRDVNSQFLFFDLRKKKYI